MKTYDVRVFLGALLLFCVIAGGFTLWYHPLMKTLADVPVSPYGFGPYPPLPEGWPAADIWPRQSANHELMMRVEIKLAHQGIDVRGSIRKNGLVYPMISDTVYIEWGEKRGPDGPVRYLARIAGDPDACDWLDAIQDAKGKFESFTEADFPSHIQVLSYEEGGIDPYQFLDLPRR